MSDDELKSLNAINRGYLRILQEFACFDVPWKSCETELFLIAEQLPRDKQMKIVEEFASRQLAPIDERFPKPGWLVGVFKRLSSEFDSCSPLFSTMIGLCSAFQHLNKKTDDEIEQAIAVAEEVERFISTYSILNLSDREKSMIEKGEVRYRNIFNLLLANLYEAANRLDARDRIMNKVDPGVTLEGLADGIVGEELDSLTGNSGAVSFKVPTKQALSDALKETPFGYYSQGYDCERFEDAIDWYRKALDAMESTISFSPDSADRASTMFDVSSMQIDRVIEKCIEHGYYSDAYRWLILSEAKGYGEEPHPELVEFIKFEKHRTWAAILTGLNRLEEARPHYLQAIEYVKSGSEREVLCLFDYAVFLAHLDEHNEKRVYVEKVRKHEKGAEALWTTVECMFSKIVINLHRSPVSGSCSISLFENELKFAEVWLDEALYIMQLRHEAFCSNRAVYFFRTCAIVYDRVGRVSEAIAFVEAAVDALERDLSMLSELTQSRVEFLQELLTVAEHCKMDTKIDFLNKQLAESRSEIT